MYSPKIAEGLVKQLYPMAKEKGVPMTKLVNEIIQDAIAQKKKSNEIKDWLIAETTDSVLYQNQLKNKHEYTTTS